jgi:hypothetical protein
MPTLTAAPEAAGVQGIRFGAGTVFLARLFDTDEVARLAAAVRAVPAGLRRQASDAATDGRMATIGEPLYRNRDRFDYYTARAQAENRLLYRHFRLAHDRVAEFFERRYGVPVVFAEDLAVPGFHEFSFGAAGNYGAGGWHYDMLHAQVPYLARHAGEIEGVVNFTVPIETPSGGTGMDLEDDSSDSPGPGGGIRVRAPYLPGVMVFNEAEYWHRIGASLCLGDGERRVTLQGHGIRFRGRWLLFW